MMFLCKPPGGPGQRRFLHYCGLVHHRQGCLCLSILAPLRPSPVLPSPLLIFFFLLLFFFLFFFLLFILPFLVFLSSFLSLPLSFLLSFTSLFHFSHSPLSCRLLP